MPTITMVTAACGNACSLGLVALGFFLLVGGPSPARAECQTVT